MKVVVTGGAGFIGSHVAEHYARQEDCEVVVYDNLSRMALLSKDAKNADYNWKFLSGFPNVRLVKGDVRDYAALEKEIVGADLVVHAAAQTAVTTSVTDPATDFAINASGAFNALEACRKKADGACFIFCSTNKVYGSNVNKINVVEKEKRYEFEDKFGGGISEGYPTDLCEHTPYGVSKLAGDLYAQDYAHVYGLRTGVFRMSCIYGERQFGVEDQGWVAHFTISSLLERPLTIFGDGKQVRDVLHVSDVVSAYDSFFRGSGAAKGNAKSGGSAGRSVHGSVFNLGGGPRNALSLMELLELLGECGAPKPKISTSGWRPGDQKVYISDISLAQKQLGWRPKTAPREGVGALFEWVKQNRSLF